MICGVLRMYRAGRTHTHDSMNSDAAILPYSQQSYHSIQPSTPTQLIVYTILPTLNPSTIYFSVSVSQRSYLILVMYQVFTGTEPRLQILPNFGVASHRQALYGTVTHVICNASPSRSVFFRTVFFPFSFCRSSPLLRFFFFLFSTFSSLAPSLFPSLFPQSCCSSSLCTTFSSSLRCLVAILCS